MRRRTVYGKVKSFYLRAGKISNSFLKDIFIRTQTAPKMYFVLQKAKPLPFHQKSKRVISPPKAFTEDTLLSSMETAGAAETTDEAERKGLGTPATRAAIIEKLVQTGFAERKGKSIVATHNGISLVSVLPEKLTSPILTSDWENNLCRDWQRAIIRRSSL